MGSSEHNCGNISSLTGGKMLNSGMVAFLILYNLNITAKLVISQIIFLRHHHSSKLLLAQRGKFVMLRPVQKAKHYPTLLGGVGWCLISVGCWSVQTNPTPSNNIGFQGIISVLGHYWVLLG